MMNRDLLKVDLHTHSKYSTRPSEWILRKLGCAESYTDPYNLYTVARERGMDFVTITDHNTLEGSLEIAHLPDTFISEEVTSYFPEDQCKIHVLVYRITEKHHREIACLRENVFDLVAYLHQEHIFHAMAHPLFALNDRLSIENLERSLIIFQNFEINGARNDGQKESLHRILEFLNHESMERLINERGIEPLYAAPWEKNLIGGSDDHSSLHIASTFTEVTDAASLDEFFEGISLKRGRVCSLPSGPKALGHNVYSIAYQFYDSKFSLKRFVNKDPLLRFAHKALSTEIEFEDGLVDRIMGFLCGIRPGKFFEGNSRDILQLIRKEARDILFNDPMMLSLLKEPRQDPSAMENAWYGFVNQISEKIMKNLADTTLEKLNKANLFDIFQALGAAGSLYTMLAPYFVAYSGFSKDHQLCRQCDNHFSVKDTHEIRRKPKITHFTDTFYDPQKLEIMREKAREFMEERTYETAYMEMWDGYSMSNHKASE